MKGGGSKVEGLEAYPDPTLQHLFVHSRPLSHKNIIGKLQA